MSSENQADIDQQLVERVQAGDKRAFDLLVGKYQHKIVGLVNRYVYDHHEAMDIAQEAFIKAYRALPRFRGIVPFILGCIVLRSTRLKTIWYLRGVGHRMSMLMLRMPNILMAIITSLGNLRTLRTVYSRTSWSARLNGRWINYPRIYVQR